MDNRRWEEVEEQLRLIGVGSWRGIADRSVMTADEALEAIANYRTRVGSWKPGGLLWAITNGVWPPADPVAAKRYTAACELRKRLHDQGAQQGAEHERIAAVVASGLKANGLAEFIRQEEREAWRAMRAAAMNAHQVGTLST
jgi:hypothetical protein